MQNVGNKAPISVYLASVIVIFFCTLSAADSVGFVPYYIDGTPSAAALADSGESSESLPIADLPQLGDTPASAGATELPVRIQITAIGLDLPVQNPSTRNIETLDAILQRGPARYVDSAHLGEDGNLIIFAHSSHLPIVHNKMFQAFNKIPDLTRGDIISLEVDNGTTYLYSVDSVRKTDSSDTVPLSVDGKRLTLVTCDTLTGKSARFVLDASFVGTSN